MIEIKKYIPLVLVMMASLMLITIVFGGANLGEANSQSDSSSDWSNWTSSKDKRQQPDQLVIEVLTHQKLIALTFDDGPDISTEKVLDVLDQYNVKATFFLVGENCLMYPDIAKRIALSGHELGNHTFSHPKFRGKTTEQIYAEINKTNRVIYETTGETPIYFRPPGGTINDNILSAAAQGNLKIVLWTPEADSKDWINPGVGTIITKVVKSAHEGSIVLMHDGGGDRSQTVYALPQIIELLQKKGFEFVTVSELMDAQTVDSPQ